MLPGLHALIGRGCKLAVSTHVKKVRKIFRELLPVLVSRHPFNKSCGHVYSSCAWSTILHASEIWLLTKSKSALATHDWAILRHIFNIMTKNWATVRSRELQVKREFEKFDLISRKKWFNWFRHVEHSSGALSKTCDTHIYGRCRPGGLAAR